MRQFTRPAAKERTNDRGDVLTPHDDPASEKGAFVAARDGVHRATIRGDGTLDAGSEPTQTYLRHGMIAVKDGVPRVYAAARKNGKGDVLFAAADDAADFRDAANTLRAAGLDPAEHLPHAAAHTFGTGKRSMLSRVHEYLRDGGVEPPAPAAATPSGRDDAAADAAQAKVALDAHRRGDLARARTRFQAADKAMPTAFQVEMGGEATPEQRAEYRAAKAEHDAAVARDVELHGAWAAAEQAAKPEPKPAAKPDPDAPVTVRGNTYAVRDELRKIPGAKYDAKKKVWTVPPAHAEAARKLVAGAGKKNSREELLRMSNAELAERGLIRTSGPRGPYVRRGTPEELNDHL